MIAISLIAVATACSSPCPVLADPGLRARHPGGAPVEAQPRHPLASYVAAADYPAAALRDREQGRVAFALGIGADGRVTACRITASSGSAALDSATCRIMRSRARYIPARDAAGTPIADVGFGEIGWTLPAG